MKREALDYIWEKFNSCYPFVHEYKENILWMYDKQVLRQKKLNRIVGESEIKVDKPSKDSICYFYQDNKNGYFDVNSREIWSKIESKFGYNYNEVKELFVCWLEEYDKIKGLTPLRLRYIYIIGLEEYDKIKGLTPLDIDFPYPITLEEYDKIKGLTMTKKRANTQILALRKAILRIGWRNMIK